MANNFRNGQVKIANEILDQLAIRASEEVYGVCAPKSNDNKLNLSQHGPKSTVSQVDGKLLVDLTVNLDKNVNVKKTVKTIQENVVRVIETMTGLNVTRVNVSVPKLVI
ncbi:Asp23/Gls24 family envelope stress response protein [Anaerococcus cruorum]|uniref:Asp23/Gls24 family envelope stress response protein n=1 Tax=Anaerococcus sp. WGS1529 TaxID=3366812 RepID=UPI00372D8232